MIVYLQKIQYFIKQNLRFITICYINYYINIKAYSDIKKYVLRFNTLKSSSKTSYHICFNIQLIDKFYDGFMNVSMFHLVVIFTILVTFHHLFKVLNKINIKIDENSQYQYFTKI